MNAIMKSLALCGIVAIAGTGCVKKPVENPVVTPTTNEVHFNFHNHFGNDELELNTKTYTNMHGEQLTISIFNYWITNIKLVKSDGTEYAEPESYRVVRANTASTGHFHLEDVPAGTYTAVKFTMGVDVPRNTSGAQTGALDPAVNGDMYWTWNTGYIQAKMEGTSPQSTLTNNAISLHIAGVQPGYESPREVTLTFGTNMVVGTQAGSINIKADAAKWFGPTNNMKIADVPSVMNGGIAAVKFADNIKASFSITSVGNE